MLLIDLLWRLFMIRLTDKASFVSLISFCALDQVPNIYILYNFTGKYTKVIEGGQQLISTEVLGTEVTDKYGVVDYYGYYLDESDEGVSRGVGVIKDVAAA